MGGQGDRVTGGTGGHGGTGGGTGKYLAMCTLTIHHVTMSHVTVTTHPFVDPGICSGSPDSGGRAHGVQH